MFFLDGISFNTKYQRIYINTKYNKLSKLVVTTQSVEYIVSESKIEITTIVFVIIRSFAYFFVINFICMNSHLKPINTIEYNKMNNDSVK